MPELDEVEALKARVAQLEAAAQRRSMPWGKILIGVVVVIVALALLQSLGPKTYGDIADQDAADCVRTGNDGAWYPGEGNLQDICRIRGNVKALQRQAIDGAQHQ